MDKFYNRDGKMILDKMVRAIHENKDYLGEVDIIPTAVPASELFLYRRA